jgi:hypothetical protein
MTCRSPREGLPGIGQTHVHQLHLLPTAPDAHPPIIADLQALPYEIRASGQSQRRRSPKTPALDRISFTLHVADKRAEGRTIAENNAGLLVGADLDGERPCRPNLRFLAVKGSRSTLDLPRRLSRVPSGSEPTMPRCGPAASPASMLYPAVFLDGGIYSEPALFFGGEIYGEPARVFHSWRVCLFISHCCRLQRSTWTCVRAASLTWSTESAE